MGNLKVKSGDRCPWCNATVQCDRMYGRGYVVRWDLPRIEWECGSGRLDNDVEPNQSAKCIAIVFKELEGLRGEIQNITQQRDDLVWLLHEKFLVQYPPMAEPNWLVHASKSREAAKATKLTTDSS